MHGEELIVKNGSITLRSMLDFGGFLEIKQFLEVCRYENCTVTFANEELVIFPNEYDAAKDALVFIYGMIAEDSRIFKCCEQYKRMLGEDGIREPTPVHYGVCEVKRAEEVK